MLTACQSGQDKETVVTEKKELIAKKVVTKKRKDDLVKAPEFVLKKVSDESKLALVDLKGKVVILDFWATWCPPCKVALPSFNNLYKKYNKKGLEIVGINVDRIKGFKDLQKLNKFIEQYKIEYPIVYSTNEVRSMYGNVTAIPTVFIINREGMIVDTFKGFSSSIETAIEKTVKQLL